MCLILLIYIAVQKISYNSSFKKRYVAHIKTMIEEVFANIWYKTRGVELQNIVLFFFQADTNKFYSYNNFIANLNQSVTGGGPGQTFVGITQLMEEEKLSNVSAGIFSCRAANICCANLNKLRTAEFYRMDNATVLNASTVKFMSRHL